MQTKMDAHFLGAVELANPSGFKGEGMAGLSGKRYHTIAYFF